MSARWASMLHWSISTPTISPAWRLGKKRRRNCCNFKGKYAKNSRLAPGKPRKRSPSRSMPTRKMCFMRCAISRAMIPRSRLRPAMKRLTRSFRSNNRGGSVGPNMADAVPENRRDSLNVPWIDTVRFVQQLSHDIRNHLNAIELQSAYISELDANPELKGEIKRLREMLSGLTA